MGVAASNSAPLPLEGGRAPRFAFPGERPTVLPIPSGGTVLEDDAFPFELLSEVAHVESWRKEIHRPIYHIHKWWAQRLGSVFRAVTLAAFAPRGSDLMRLFYQPVRLPDSTVFDPFMGSGTTIGEALKLGARAVGRDINPVAYFLVRNAVAVHDRAAIEHTFTQVRDDVAHQIRHYYRTRLPSGEDAEVLYYFWVKQVGCPSCSEPVDLFSSYIFARHAYAKKFPAAQAVCPRCGEVNCINVSDEEVRCGSCSGVYNPQEGPAKGQRAHCGRCDSDFAIAKAVRNADGPPAHRLYAKLVLTEKGDKVYLRATDYDAEVFAEAEAELARRPNPYPIVRIEPGHNTNQVMGYNYQFWHQMFNARQLLGISIIADRVRDIDDEALRDLFTCVLSGALEFNNMFASYKGEGTGAVRHMFAHHILKPERTPLEANLWGTPKSSGSFSTLFEGRLKRALDYADNPYELRLAEQNGRVSTSKVYGLSEKIGFDVARSYDDFDNGKRVYLSCGNSADTDLADGSIDAVITDPPFFDNVHYSELADFFHVWQQHILQVGARHQTTSTRSPDEVQDSKVAAFTSKLSEVFLEARRVLKDDGLLIFSYHHSRPDGWRSILEAIMVAGFYITAVQPIKSEMSGAMPKNQAKEPIDLDIIIVCRKRMAMAANAERGGEVLNEAVPRAQAQVARFISAGRTLSRNDVRVILYSQALLELSSYAVPDEATAALEEMLPALDAAVHELHALQH